MDSEDSACNPLERMLNDENAEPTALPLSLLKSITNNFSSDKQIGSGGFAVVYKGQLRHGIVAVKKLTRVDVDETKFHQEIYSLMRVKHKNIVRFLGYCSDTQGKVWKIGRKNVMVMAEERQRFLCFEYLPRGSLDKYISDASEGLEWMTRYQIIKGICKGLHYLHEQKIVHLDLKPANILLDQYMLPKITDFGLSRCFDEEQTRAMTSNVLGSLGYMAPEFFSGEITYKSDIYSLGILIIEILTGKRGYPDMDNVLKSWSFKFETSPGDTKLKSVRVCTEIGIECTAFNPANRPNTQVILSRLEEMESKYSVIKADLSTSTETDASSSVSDLVDELLSMDVAGASSPTQQISSVTEWPVQTSTEESSSSVSAAPSPLQRITGVLEGPRGTCRKILYDQTSETSKMLDIHPLELRFPRKPCQVIECPVTLTNRTDRYVGVWITPTCMDTSFNMCFVVSFNESAPIFKATLKPHSTSAVTLQMKAPREPPPDTMFEVLMVVTRSMKECLEYSGITAGQEYYAFEGKPNIDSEFLQRVEKVDGEVHRATLKAVICDPASCKTVIHSQRFISTPPEFDYIDVRDVHPTETWILVSCLGSSVSILNYETQEIEMAPLYINRVIKPPTTDTLFDINQAKFIAQEQWFVVGDSDGWIHVYSYTTKDKVMEFKPHQSSPDVEAKTDEVVFAVHPTSPYLLTSGTYSIKLWDWSKGWKCTREFKYNFSEKCYLRWSPMETDTFITMDTDDDGYVWNIHSSDPITILEESYEPASCFYRDGHQNFMVTHEEWRAHIWDMQTKKHVHKLFPLADRTYRLAEKVECPSWVHDMVLTGTKDSTRLIMVLPEGFSVMEINMPTLDTDGLHADGPN